jgi:uncharacterized protein (DUF1501 family)
MFRLTDNRPVRDCRGASRRDFLRIGSLALGGLSLPGLLASKAKASAQNRFVKDKAVVLLFLQGGPSQIEFFDPKMSAPVEFRSVTGEVQTKIPGITFGGTFPRLASMTDKIAVVRSFASGNTDHQKYLSVAGANNSFDAPMGAVYSRVVGSVDARTGIPTNCIVLPEAVSPGLKLGSNFETGSLKSLLGSGALGPSFAAFDPSGGGELKKNLELRLDAQRLGDRKSLLNQLDGFKRQMERTHALDSVDVFQQQAYDVILRGIAQAFDVSREDPKTLGKYDTSHIFKQEDLQKFFDMKRSSNLLGKQMLLARRLIERGCGFVTVCDAGWDMHANNNSPKDMAGMTPKGLQVDHAVAAFIEDLEQRGLSDKVLLIVTGEMGRSPRINKGGGRDHYGNLTPLLIAGGGLKMGQIIGQTDKNASNPTTEKYTPQHLFATVMNVLFDTGEVRIATDVPTGVAKLVSEGKPIRELV